MTYLTEFFESESNKNYGNWKKEAFYPNYPSFIERENALEVLDVDTVSRSAQEALEHYHKPFDVFGLEEFRGFLTDVIELDRTQALVYSQYTNLNRFFCKHFGNRTTVSRLVSQIKKLNN